MTPTKQEYREKFLRAYEEERIRRGVEYGECFCGCKAKTPLETHTHRAMMTLMGHPTRFLRHHYVATTRPRDPGPVEVNGKIYRLIPLTKGLWATVSAHRYDYLIQFNWQAMWAEDVRGYYAVRFGSEINGHRISVLMHREILGLDFGDPRKGDHIKPEETLNNTDENLRLSDRSGQQHNQRRRKTNTSGYKGVTRDKSRNKWVAGIMINYKHLYQGRYDEKIEAARAYDRAAIKYFGDFALLNFPRSDYDLGIENS